MDGGDPREAWARTKAHHPAPGELISVGQGQLEDLATFLERQAIISLPSTISASPFSPEQLDTLDILRRAIESLAAA